MARSYSTRRTAYTSTPRGSALSRPPQIATELHSVVRTLRLIYSACVTTELALQAQNADRDRDISLALRHTVGDPVSEEAERLAEIAARL